MVAALRAKSSDRAAILKKLLPAIKKRYKIVVPKNDRPVLETMIFAILLEDSSVQDAENSYKRLFEVYPDLNEVRVSSPSEIEVLFAAQSEPHWRAFRIRNVLQYVFEKSYTFEFEGLKKKTLELATKQLTKIKSLTPFVRNYTLQAVIGAHSIPIDTSMARALAWLGLVPHNQDPDQMGETLKSVVRKSDVPLFCFSIRCLATDDVVRDEFDPALYPPPEEGHDGAEVVARLEQLYKSAASHARARRAAEREAEAKKLAAKEARAAKKVDTKKGDGKKPEAKKPAPKKLEVKKAPPKKGDAKATASSKKPAKKGH